MFNAVTAFALVAILLSATVAESVAGGATRKATAAAVDTSASPERVRHRGLLEDAMAVPGLLIYLPIAAFFDISKLVANAVWNQHLLDRAKAWMTTADGRAGFRPLSSTQIGTGGHVFYKNLVAGGDASLTSSWGSTSRRRHHTAVLAWPRGRLLPGHLKVTTDYEQKPKESFFGFGHLSRFEDRVTQLEESLHATVSYDHKLSKQLELEGDLSYYWIDIRAGLSEEVRPIVAVYARDQVPGLGVRSHFVEVNGTARTSFVDVPGSPTRGNRSLLRAGYAQSVDGGKLSHLKIFAATEQFRELFHRRTISLRVGTEWRAAVGDNRIPFYGLASLGGTDYLRGYKRGRPCNQLSCHFRFSGLIGPGVPDSGFYSTSAKKASSLPNHSSRFAWGARK